MKKKLEWKGLITSIQPRIRLNRSFDQRSHSYLGYSLRIDGAIGGDKQVFWIGIGKATQETNQFHSGVTIAGDALPVSDSRTESVDYYKVSNLRIVQTHDADIIEGPPRQGIPPSLETYRARGHRRLSSRTYQSKCTTCIWGCNMPVVITVDQWKPGQKKYRFETFCYGPKSCRHYDAGPTRKVPGRSGISWEEEDWVDEHLTEYRGPDD